MVRDVLTGNPKLDKTPNEVTIASRVVKWFTISGTQVNTKLHRSINNVVISESGTGENILYILILGEVPRK